MKVAAYQAPLLASGSRAAIGLVAAQRAACEAENVEVLLCPEAVLGGLADDAADPSGLAIGVANGELASVLAPLASDRLTTIIGFTEAGADGRLYNSAAVFAQGSVIGVYRKRRPAIRSSVYSSGDESPVFEIAGLRFGLMICNDTNHPEFAADLARRGAARSRSALRSQQQRPAAGARGRGRRHPCSRCRQCPAKRPAGDPRRRRRR